MVKQVPELHHHQTTAKISTTMKLKTGHSLQVLGNTWNHGRLRPLFAGAEGFEYRLSESGEEQSNAVLPGTIIAVELGGMKWALQERSSAVLSRSDSDSCSWCSFWPWDDDLNTACFLKSVHGDPEKMGQHLSNASQQDPRRTRKMEHLLSNAILGQGFKRWLPSRPNSRRVREKGEESFQCWDYLFLDEL